MEIFTSDNIWYMLDGLRMTVIISLATAVLSILFGTVLAIMRNYAKGKLKVLALLSGAYIEFFRCTPNLLWILMLRFALRGSGLFIAILSFTVFTSAVMAEIIRGGMNSIGRGQYEAAESQGFGFFHTMTLIVLPQTFRTIIPALLSQMTTIIKDTSFLKAVDIHEFMRNSSIILGTANTIGQILLLYGFVALTYFVLNFLLSTAVRAYHKSIRLA